MALLSLGDGSEQRRPSSVGDGRGGWAGWPLNPE